MKYAALFSLLLITQSANAETYNPNCDYKDEHNKCVSIQNEQFITADLKLNDLYKKASALFKSTEEKDPRYNLLKPLIKSQKSWLKYRDEHCALSSGLTSFFPVNDEPITKNKQCIADLTITRNSQIERLIIKHQVSLDPL